MSDENSVPATPRRRYLPLLHRVAGLNAILLMLAVACHDRRARPDPRLVVPCGRGGRAAGRVLAVAVALNVYLVRRIVSPVQTLTALARRVDLTAEAERMPPPRRARKQASWR